MAPIIFSSVHGLVKRPVMNRLHGGRLGAIKLWFVSDSVGAIRHRQSHRHVTYPWPTVVAGPCEVAQSVGIQHRAVRYDTTLQEEDGGRFGTLAGSARN
jgi:hypothetical protein